VRITTKFHFDMNTGEVFADEGFEYEGELALCGGGPSAEQKAAAASQANLTNQLAGVAQQNENFTEAQRNKTTPFYSNLMTNGPDYLKTATDYASGTNARAYAPARAALIKRLGTTTGLPSGSRDQALTDFDSSRARGFDDSLMGLLADKQAAQERGAAGIMGEAQQANPLGYYQGAEQGNQSILQAPLQKPGIAGLLGGLAGSAATAYAGR
jgi:hypothetical protein